MDANRSSPLMSRLALWWLFLPGVKTILHALEQSDITYSWDFQSKRRTWLFCWVPILPVNLGTREFGGKGKVPGSWELHHVCLALPTEDSLKNWGRRLWGRRESSTVLLFQKCAPAWYLGIISPVFIRTTTALPAKHTQLPRLPVKSNNWAQRGNDWGARGGQINK